MPSCCLSIFAAGLLAAAIDAQIAPGQIAPGNAVVAVRLVGSPATQLLAVDLVTGAATALPRFPADVMPPLAIEFDRIDGELLLAVDLGNGSSRLLRYTLQNGVPVAERALADVPGHVTELAPSAGRILAAVDGPQGGIYQLSRYGGPATLLLALPRLAVLQTDASGSNFATVVWSGTAGPPPADPGSGLVNLSTGAFMFGPTSFVNYPHPDLTGAITLPFPQPRLVLAHADGTI
ncbi:MAG TPA: hypothetical protein VK348_10145, partial [Planctomycetota bacterium]|nr:hypothetical protein [Planctomycetota bacterium]